MKICSKCKVLKDESEFDKNRTIKGGLHYQCKACYKKYRADNKEVIAERGKQYRAENREAIAERHKQYRSENGEAIAEYNKKYQANNKEIMVEYKRQYYLDNKEVITEHRKKYRADNKEYYTEYMKQYRAENKAKHNALNAKRRASKRNQTPELTDLEKRKIELYYEISRYLGTDWHVDHIKPISRGGLHHPDNLQVIPATENLKKHTNEDYHIPKHLCVRM